MMNTAINMLTFRCWFDAMRHSALRKSRRFTVSISPTVARHRQLHTVLPTLCLFVSGRTHTPMSLHAAYRRRQRYARLYRDTASFHAAFDDVDAAIFA